jgi:hypothetical protein
MFDHQYSCASGKPGAIHSKKDSLKDFSKKLIEGGQEKL